MIGEEKDPNKQKFFKENLSTEDFTVLITSQINTAGI